LEKLKALRFRKAKQSAAILSTVLSFELILLFFGIVIFQKPIYSSDINLHNISLFIFYFFFVGVSSYFLGDEFEKKKQS